jgi:transcriptional regulator with XRE-family HTH domain
MSAYRRHVDHKTEVREFLSTRRAKLNPEQAGLPAHGGNRRVPGLRREEVATLAGMSVDYYTRLERGNLGGVSESVLQSLAGALRLDDAERSHLFHLARTANASPRTQPRRTPPPGARPVVRRILDSMDGVPAFVRNGRFDVLAANRLGEALYTEMFNDPVRPVNTARFVFLNPRALRFWDDWEKAARDTVAFLRAEAGRNPYDPTLTELVGELATRSDVFRTLWASHDVRYHRTGVKVFNHPVVGRIELPFEALTLPADPGLTLNVYSAEPGTAAAEALVLLASWAATHHERTASVRDAPERASNATP